MAKPILIFLFLLSLFNACKNSEVIEKKNAQGIVTERIQLAGDTSEGKNGVYEYFTETGLPKEIVSYKNGKIHGERKLYENGFLYSIENLNQGLFEGQYKVFYPTGKLKVEGQYTSNVTSGIWKGYYASGQLKEEVNMADNEENGPFTEYYENGAIKVKGSYLHGTNEHGELLMYDSTGALERKMDCLEGICKTTWKRENTSN